MVELDLPAKAEEYWRGIRALFERLQQLHPLESIGEDNKEGLHIFLTNVHAKVMLTTPENLVSHRHTLKKN